MESHRQGGEIPFIGRTKWRTSKKCIVDGLDLDSISEVSYPEKRTAASVSLRVANHPSVLVSNRKFLSVCEDAACRRTEEKARRQRATQASTLTSFLKHSGEGLQL